MRAAKAFKVLRTPPPTFSPAEIPDLVAREFGLSVIAQALPSERDQNYRLSATDGRQYVLKIANEAESLEVLDLQTRALCHIATVAPTVPVPRVHRASNGAPWGTFAGPRRVSFRARILDYLPGVPWRQGPTTKTLQRGLGHCLGDLDRALVSFQHVGACGDLLWNCARVGRLRGLLHRVGDDARRRLALKILDKVEWELALRIPGLRCQIIHNDLNPSNVLLDPDQDNRIVGIIDFGDMLFAPLISEVAVAASYQLEVGNDPIEAVCQFLAAYHAANPLERNEIDCLIFLVLARLLTTVAITEWRARLMPDNRDYILRHNPGSWEMLARLDVGEPGAASDRFRAACASAGEQLGESTLERRARLMGPAYHLFYDDPVHIVRGTGAWLFDSGGRRYLDLYNNVAHVGHCHPRIVDALHHQAAVLNTHTRYLNDLILAYSERLLKLFPSNLNRVMFSCTGSEANELALRIARATTGRRGIIATEHAYHGNTAALAELSAVYYKSAEPTGPHVRLVPAPDTFRRRFQGDDAALSAAYAQSIDDAIRSLDAHGYGLAAFIVDPHFTSDGILSAPPGYLAAAVERVHAAGGLFIADEIQAGFGRLGTHLWSYETHGLIPDMVTLGKPIGNGYPIGATVTNDVVLANFARATRYFNTFGGSPVSAAVGLAVLEVMQEERLQENARIVGASLTEQLRSLQKRHEQIGDIRGQGLFQAVEMVIDRNSLEPATEMTRAIVNRLRAHGILLNSIGPCMNILKLRPPLVFSLEQVSQFVGCLHTVLSQFGDSW